MINADPLGWPRTPQGHSLPSTQGVDVLGLLGSGRAGTLKRQQVDLSGQDVHTLMADEHDYTHLVRALGGQVVALGPTATGDRPATATAATATATASNAAVDASADLKEL